MGRGFEGIKELPKGNFAKTPSGLWFRLGPGETTVVRFLEQDDEIFWAMTHEVPVPNRSWGRDVVCVDQKRDGTPCPGCERDLKRRFRGYINVIWDDAPIFVRNDEGRVVKDESGNLVTSGTEPQVAIWSSGIRLFEELDEINANYRGLTSRRFKVKRKGSGTDTKYFITPEDVDAGFQELTDHEKKLADSKFDLTPFVTPPTYEEFLEELGFAPKQNTEISEAAAETRRNVFMRQRERV